VRTPISSGSSGEMTTLRPGESVSLATVKPIYILKIFSGGRRGCVARAEPEKHLVVERPDRGRKKPPEGRAGCKDGSHGDAAFADYVLLIGYSRAPG